MPPRSRRTSRGDDSRPSHSAGPVAASARPLGQDVLQLGQLKRIAADHQITHRQQIVHHRTAALCLADAADAVVADHFYDRSQRPGRVETGRRPQRWVAECDRRDTIIGYFHCSSHSGLASAGLAAAATARVPDRCQNRADQGAEARQ